MNTSPQSSKQNSYTFIALMVVFFWSLNPLAMGELINIPVFELAALIFFTAFTGFCINYSTSPVKKEKLLSLELKGSGL